MKSRASIVLIGILVMLFTIGWTTYSQKSSSASPAWEYRYAERITDDQINQFGAAGWEMVNFTTDQYGNARFYFKRRK